MQAELRDMSWTGPRFEEFEPEDPARFAFSITLTVGTVGSVGADNFEVYVKSVASLAESYYNDGGVRLLRHTVIMKSWDFMRFEAFVEQYVSSCTGDSWNEIAVKLGRLGHWEFEDLDQRDPEPDPFFLDRPNPFSRRGLVGKRQSKIREMRAEIRSLTASNGDALSTVIARNDTYFDVTVMLRAGPIGSADEECVVINVASAPAICDAYNHNDIALLKNALIMQSFDPKRLEAYIRQYVLNSTGADWKEIRLKLLRLGNGEIQDLGLGNEKQVR